MTSPGRILIVDDNPDFVTIYRVLLEGQGLVVETAHNADEALATLAPRGAEFDVVLLDQKLQGPGGPDSGLDVFAKLQAQAPFAKVIIITGYATPAAVERAFQLGVYDYLVKNGAFEALVRAKVRNAVEVTRAVRLAALSREQLVSELRSTWARVNTETDRNLKGRALEDLVKLLFRATPGFERVTTRLQNEIEELDIVVENRSEDPAWRADGAAYLLGECKNWSKPCGAPELRSFYAKLTNKFGHARTGFFFAPGGFAKTFEEARQQKAEGSVLVIPVDAADLGRWIDADDRMAVVNELKKRAVFSSRA